MNRKIVIGLMLSLLFIFLATCINTALAETIRYDYQNAGGSCVIDVPGQTRIYLIASGGYSSDFGRGDMIQISVDTGNINAQGLPVFKLAVSFEDNPERYDWSGLLGSAHPRFLVKSWQMQVFRIGKTSFVLWTIPLVVPATGAPNPTPEVVLPPGLLVLRGYGESESGQAPPPTHPTGWLKFGSSDWYYRIDTASQYTAHATLFCLRWRYFGPVAEDFVGTGFESSSIVDRTWTWKLPDPT